MGQIFDSHVHHLKLFKIKNPFRIVQTNPQIPQKWVAPFYFLRDMFCWDRDTLIVTLTTLFSRHLFFGQLGLVHNVDQLKYTRHPTCLESSLSSVTSAKYLTLLLSTIQTTKSSTTEN